MKFLFVLICSVLLQTGRPPWLTDFKKARAEATQSGKHLLLNFSGSDWCLPCIRMHKLVFETPVFDSMALKELVLVKADFPRLKKNRLSREQQMQNERLAEQYNPAGKFPYTLLLDSTGKVIKAWDGLPNESAGSFVEEIKSAIDANQ